MNQRNVLEHRLATLDGLLDAPGGPLGPNAGELGQRLHAGWRTERRLLQRLLGDAQGDDVHATIRAWRQRTAAFAAKSDDDRPAWVDREGVTWDAKQVLELLDDTQERIDRWVGSRSSADDTKPIDASGGHETGGPSARHDRSTAHDTDGPSARHDRSAAHDKDRPSPRDDAAADRDADSRSTPGDPTSPPSRG